MCCGRSTDLPRATAKAAARPKFGPDGLLVLAANTDDCAGYDGIGSSQSVYVVGYETPHERVFMRARRNDAMQYMKDKRLSWDTLVRTNASKICADVYEQAIVSARP